VVFDKENPYNYKIYDGYMIHKTLPGLYTYDEAQKACKSLREGYNDWTLPDADYLDLMADKEGLVMYYAEEGWYWSSWILQGSYYTVVNLWKNEAAYTTDPNAKLKVLPVRKINN
jgi:hypothetical protein